MKYIVEVGGELPKTGSLSKAKEWHGISSLIESVADQICDNYCKYRERADNEGWEEDELIEKYCNNCPLCDL